jgi:hypothetical protein
MSNGVRVALVKEADRPAGDVIEGELILRELRVVEVECGHDLTAGDDENPTPKLVRQAAARAGLTRKPRGKARRSLREIARVLEEEQAPTRTGAPWRVASPQVFLRCHGKR